MLHNEGKMRLIMACQFSPQDLQAIQQWYELLEALLTRLDTELNPQRLELMGQLKEKTCALVLLSATPMQIDPIKSLTSSRW